VFQSLNHRLNEVLAFNRKLFNITLDSCSFNGLEVAYRRQILGQVEHFRMRIVLLFMIDLVLLRVEEVYEI
jgi:hypothetical protein